MTSIYYIQQAQKQTDNQFNDVIAQLYKDAKENAEKAEKERVRQAKEKELEEQRIDLENKRRIEEAKRAEANRIAREHIKAIEQQNSKRAQEISRENEAKRAVPNTTTNGNVGSNWSSVSPQQAAAYMASKTGVPQGTWERIIYAESTNNPTITNSIGCFGYLQLHPVHGNVSGMTPQQYLDTAVGVYSSQGLSAWEVTTNGMVN